MKTIAVFSCFKAVYGGNFICQIKSISQGFIRQGYSVVLVFPTQAKNRQWCIDLMKEGYDLIFIDGNVSFFARVCFIMKLFYKLNVRIVYSHFGLCEKELVLISVLSMQRLKFVIHIHSELPNPNNFFRRLLQRIKCSIFNLTKTHIITVGNTMRDYFLHYGLNEEQIICIPNGNDFKRLDVKFNKKDIRHIWGIRDDCFLFLMMGYNVYIKGVDIVVSAIHKLRLMRNTEDLQLAVIVASNEEQFKKDIIDSFGSFPSWLLLFKPTEDVGLYYRMADCFISASRTEGFSFALAEAIYMKLPILSSYLENVAWCSKYKSVSFFKSGDVDNLSNLINMSLSYINNNDCEESSKQIEGDYGIEQWNRQVMKFLKKFL